MRIGTHVIGLFSQSLFCVVLLSNIKIWVHRDRDNGNECYNTLTSISAKNENKNGCDRIILFLHTRSLYSCHMIIFLWRE